MLIAVDFDHTLVCLDKPIPGAKEAMQKLKDMGHNILIHSCNNPEWIRKVLSNNEIPYDYIWGDSEHDKGKPVCAAYIDDRGIGFDGDWDKAIQEVEEMENRRKKIPGSKGLI